MKKALVTLLIITSTFFILAPFASAHENYVLPKAEIDAGMRDASINVFDSLKNPQNLTIGVSVAAGVSVLVVIYLFFELSKLGIFVDKQLKKMEPSAHVMLRIALSASLMLSAFFNSFLGPEISAPSLPFGQLIHYAIFVLGALIMLGLYTEIASALSLAILLLATITYREYMLTYFNYFGEFLALIIFGSRHLSMDKILFQAKKIRRKIKKYEIPLIRITYGISVLYPAISIKIFHPIIIIEIVNQYHLNQIHWLFPPDPLLIALGTGLAQILVGLCLVFGFETRINSFITFLLYAGSIYYFKEAVWPHIILLALALYLVINNGGGFTLDELIVRLKAKSQK